MDKDELRKQIAAERKRVEAATKKRDTIVMLAVIGIYFLIFYLQSDKPESVDDYFSIFLAALLAGGMHHAINSEVYENLHTKNETERQYLEQLQKELREKEHHE